jgi:DNA-binding response OmpR family regulator
MTKRWYVLIVEDDVWLAEQFIRSLEMEGVDAAVVHDAFAALDAIDVRRPDAIILDVLLGGPNAFTLLHEMRSHSDLARLPVILCTNSAANLAKEDVAVYGVVKVLDKATMKPGDIAAAVRRALL